MPHGSNDGEDDKQARQPARAGSLLRPFMWVDGQTPENDDELDVATLVVARDPAPARTGMRELTIGQRKVLAHCRRSVAIAELAGRLDLPLPVIKVLVGDLSRAEYVFTRSPELDRDDRPSIDLLERVLRGLRERT